MVGLESGQLTWESAAQLANLWSAFNSFQIQENEIVQSLLLDPQHTNSVSLAIKKLNSGELSCPEGFCIVYSRSSETHYVLYRGNARAAAMARFKRDEIGVSARLCAAKAVATARWRCLTQLVLLYRLMEFLANVVLLTLMTWLVQPWVLIFLFLVLWYLPAALHMESFVTPILYPIYNFVVDDFSFLGLHPSPKSGRRMYLLAICRVILLLTLIPTILLAEIRLPEVRDMLIHSSTVDKINHLANVEKRKLVLLTQWLWCVFGTVVLVLSILWVLLTILILLVPRIKGQPSPIAGVRFDELLCDIDSLGYQIQMAAKLSPPECRTELCKLQAQNSTLNLTNFVSTFGPAWAVCLHLAIDTFNAVSMIVRLDTLRGIALLTITIFTLAYMQGTQGGVATLYRESCLSWSRGVFTDDYLAFIRADKGVQAIPALIIIASALPYTANSVISAVGGLGSIVIGIVLVVPFVFQELDLGIEREGRKDEAQYDNTVSSVEMPCTAPSDRAEVLLGAESNALPASRD